MMFEPQDQTDFADDEKAAEALCATLVALARQEPRGLHVALSALSTATGEVLGHTMIGILDRLEAEHGAPSLHGMEKAIEVSTEMVEHGIQVAAGQFRIGADHVLNERLERYAQQVNDNG